VVFSDLENPLHMRELMRAQVMSTVVVGIAIISVFLVIFFFRNLKNTKEFLILKDFFAIFRNKNN
jgi:hypothetical protein